MCGYTFRNELRNNIIGKTIKIDLGKLYIDGHEVIPCSDFLGEEDKDFTEVSIYYEVPHKEKITDYKKKGESFSTSEQYIKDIKNLGTDLKMGRFNEYGEYAILLIQSFDIIVSRNFEQFHTVRLNFQNECARKTKFPVNEITCTIGGLIVSFNTDGDLNCAPRYT